MHAFEVDQKQEPARELVSLQEAKEQPYATAKFLEVQDGTDKCSVPRHAVHKALYDHIWFNHIYMVEPSGSHRSHLQRVLVATTRQPG